MIVTNAECMPWSRAMLELAQDYAFTGLGQVTTAFSRGLVSHFFCVEGVAEWVWHSAQDQGCGFKFLSSRGGDVTVYVLDLNQPISLTLLFYSCVSFCLYGPFNRISFHKFSRQLPAFSLSSSGLISALLVLSTIYLFMKSLPQPWYNPLWLTRLQAPTN